MFGGLQRPDDAVAIPSDGSLPLHGHGAYLSVARMAGFSDGEQAPKEDDRYTPYGPCGACLSNPQFPELLQV